MSVPSRAGADRPLTTTSFAVLGLLALRPWSAYELAKQMERSLRFVWPRAESKVYEEPKKLVAHGLATARREPAGRRFRTVYTITAAGRAQLRGWLEQPGGLPVLEFEGLLKVLFADHGSRDDLVATLSSLRQQAAERMSTGAALAEEYLAGRGPFPERMHVNALAWIFLWEQHRTLERWAAWAEGVVNDWPDVAGSPDATTAALDMMAERLRGDRAPGGGGVPDASGESRPSRPRSS